MVTFLSKRRWKLDDAQDGAMLEGPLIILNPNCCLMAPLSGVLMLLCTLDIFLQKNQHQCMWPRTHVVKPSWGAFSDPKIGSQKKRPLQASGFGAPCGCMQVAANQLYAAFHPESPSPCLHPRSALFCAPKVSVVHREKQQQVAWIFMQTWELPVDKNMQQATQAVCETDENLKHPVSTACRPRVFQMPFLRAFQIYPMTPLQLDTHWPEMWRQ